MDRLQAVRPHRARRNSDAELEPEFVGDTLLAPGWVVTDHFSNELPKVIRQGRAAGSGFPLPEEPERLAVPADQSRRFDDHQGGPPLEESGPEDQSHTSGVGEPARSNLMLLIKGKTCSGDATAMTSGVGKVSSKAGVVILTRLSVH